MRREAGFSLISVLIALVIISVGILVVSRTSAAVTAAHANAGNRSIALAIATSYLEKIRGRDPTTLATETPVRVTEDGQPDPNGPFQRSLVVTPVTHNLVRVHVLVSYPRGSLPIELVTLAFTGAT